MRGRDELTLAGLRCCGAHSGRAMVLRGQIYRCDLRV
jgi:hypothetical protein